MSTKTQTEKLNELIRKWDLSQKVLAQAVGLSSSMFLKKLGPKYPYYTFSEAELLYLYGSIGKMSDELKRFSNTNFNYYTRHKNSEKFQNNPEKKEGAVSGKKKEFAGGTLTAIGKNSPDDFRPFKTTYVIHDCDEQGNPVDIAPFFDKSLGEPFK